MTIEALQHEGVDGVDSDSGSATGHNSEKSVPLEEPGEISRQESKPRDIPPDGGYGWICVACCFLINAHTWGVNSVSLTFQIGF